MSFRFNFGEVKNNSINDQISTTSPECLQSSFTDIAEHHFEYIEAVSQNLDIVKLDKDVHLKYVTNDVVEEELKARDSSIKSALANHSDLIPGVYEGGLKIWECSLDLLMFLKNERILLKNQKVLEIGCGAGLPGIFSFLQGAEVTFQDFNSEVLDLVTIPNLLLNCPPEERDTLKSTCKFIYGDWSAVENQLKNTDNRYDVILTSETIYNEESQSKLLNLMKSTLKPEGTIYLAAKTYYFGVGGGIRQFEDIIEKDGQLGSVICQNFTEGLQREIIRITFKT